MFDDLLSSIRDAAEVDELLVADMTVRDHTRPTPCSALDLGAVTAHLIGGLSGMADVAEGRPLSFDNDPDLATSDPAAELRAATQRLIDDYSAPGKIEQTFTMPWGPATGRQLLSFELIELIVHGWDIARSLSRSITFDDRLCAAVLADAQLWVDESARTPQLFGREVTVAEDAPAIDRLVAFLGRDPAWTPPEVR